MSQLFKIPDEFRAFMRQVAAKVDFGEIDTAVGDFALEHECGRGGRIEANSDVYRFTYLSQDGHGRWEIELHAQQIRDIAGGVVHEVPALALAEGTRTKRGEPLLVWGEYDVDALRVRTRTDLGIAVDGMYALAAIEPRLIRLWSTSDDQVVAVLSGFECAVYVVRSPHGYGRSVGDPTRTDLVDVIDPQFGVLSIPAADLVPWRIARPALLRFAETGELGDPILLDGSIPTQLLAFGDVDRSAELATRRAPPADPALSSLARKAPQAEWATRLVDGLLGLQLIEIDTQIIDGVLARITMLLLQYGNDALDDAQSADQLAREIAGVRGVGALFATAGDLQIALRRSQEPATQPDARPLR